MGHFSLTHCLPFRYHVTSLRSVYSVCVCLCVSLHGTTSVDIGKRKQQHSVICSFFCFVDSAVLKTVEQLIEIN